MIFPGSRKPVEGQRQALQRGLETAGETSAGKNSIQIVRKLLSFDVQAAGNVHKLVRNRYKTQKKIMEVGR